MHMFFTEEELEWIDTTKFKWAIIEGCPDNIRESIEKKKKIIDNQGGGNNGSQDKR